MTRFNFHKTNTPWWQEKSVWAMLFLGLSAGVPILLIFSSLSLWLREAGLAKSSVTYFSWAALGFSFKFVWAPLVDKLPIPILTQRLGRRRGWLLLSQIAVIGSIIFMAMTDPKNSITSMAIGAVLLGFTAATHDIALDAFRIESARKELQALLASTYIAGYRVGMIAAGAGSLYLAQWFGSTSEQYSYEAWRNTYCCMSLLILLGIITTLCVNEPTPHKFHSHDEDKTNKKTYPYSTADYCKFLLTFSLAVIVFISVFIFTPTLSAILTNVSSLEPQSILKFLYSMLVFLLAIIAAFYSVKICVTLKLVNYELFDEGYRQPILNFFQRYGKLTFYLLLLVCFYRISDIVIGVVANIFYQDLGYSKSEIASIAKIFGVGMTILGSFMGGFLVLKIGIMRVLMIGAVLSAGTNLLFMWLATTQPNLSYLTLVICADNLSGGIAIAAFIAWLSSLTDTTFTAVQYAILSSLMTLFPKFLGGYSGSLVEHIGYSYFFLFTAILGIPVLILIYYINKKTQPKN